MTGRRRISLELNLLLKKAFPPSVMSKRFFLLGYLLHALNQKTKSGLQLDYCKNKSNFLLRHSPVVVSCIINSQSNFKQ
jgi:hypothetical protein